MHLAEVAEHGVVAARDARGLGIGQSELRGLVRTGQLLPLVRGWYAVAPPDGAAPWHAADPFAAARALHRLRTVALLRSFAGRVTASHQSALVLRGGRLWRADLETVHLTRTHDDHSRHRRGAVLHPALSVPPSTTSDGLSTVPLAVAVVQVGLVPTRGGRRPEPLESLIAADGALHAGAISRDQLDEALALHRRHPHVEGVRLLLRHADGRHESVGETRLAQVMRVLGYAFTPQVPVTTGRTTRRGDFGIDGTEVIVEFDGMAKYSVGTDGTDPAAIRRALKEEKARQSDLEDAGKEVARVGWADLDRPGAIKAKIDRAIDRSTLRRRPA